MKVLQIIHGYPMRYNAGSEVYTQGLAQVLAERHEVRVFTRRRTPFCRNTLYGRHRPVRTRNHPSHHQHGEGQGQLPAPGR